MKIAITHSQFSYVGGSEKYIYYLVQRLLDEGHEVHYFCTKWEDFSHPNFHFHRVPMWKWLRFLKGISFALFTDRKVKREDFDIVHGFYKTFSQDLYTDGNGLVTDYYRRFVLPSKGPVARFFRKYSLYYFFERYLEKKRFDRQNFEKIICMSAFIKDQIRDYYGLDEEDFTVLYNGMDCRFFHPDNVAKYNSEIREELGLAGDDTVFLLIGNDYRRKNVDTALEALAKVDDETAKLLVVGRDKNIDHYRDRARDLGLASRTVFAGPRRDIQKIFAASDAFILPSFFDVFGMVVLESMATGRPAIVSRRAGASEIITDENGFILEDCESAEELAGHMTTMLDREHRERLGQKAREKAEEYSWDRHFEQLMEIYREVAEKKGRTVE